MRAPVKAIETEYAGCRFRSRLEARWAVALTEMGAEWRYEPEGFDLHSGRYLPDFSVGLACPDGGLRWFWLEVKGETPTPREETLMEELTEATGQQGFFVYGDIVAGGPVRVRHTQLLVGRSCGHSHAYTCSREWVVPLTALTAARSARFEHGEMPIAPLDVPMTRH